MNEWLQIFEIIYVNCGLRNENESDLCSNERYLQSPFMLLSVNLLLHLFSALPEGISKYQDTLKTINLNRFSCTLCKKGSDVFLLRNLISLLPNKYLYWDWKELTHKTLNWPRCKTTTTVYPGGECVQMWRFRPFWYYFRYKKSANKIASNNLSDWWKLWIAKNYWMTLASNFKVQ